MPSLEPSVISAIVSVITLLVLVFGGAYWLGKIGSRVTRLETDVAQLATVVAQLTVTVARNSEQIAALTATVAQHSEQIERNSEQIAALTITVARHSEQIAALTETVARHSDQIAELTVTLARQGEQIAQLGRDMQEGFRMLRDSDQQILTEMRHGNRQLLQALSHTHNADGEPAFRLPVAAE